MRPEIALTGMACRVPGARSPVQLWQLMLDGDNTVTRLSPDWWRGTVDDVEMFDASFFGISPREAAGIDPQQRMLLEVAYEALEDAGLPPGRLAGTETGVFVGQHTSDYARQVSDAAPADIHAMMGSAVRGMTSGRLSFAFDLRGPSVTVDAACSSALVAVHQAVRSIRTGECSVAIAAGVNLALRPDMDEAFRSAGMAAGDGQCKFGDAAADGFVRSDGVAVVVLRRLDDAVAAGDRVRAVVHGSAVNNDGRASGYLVNPAVDGQERVLRAACRDAGIEPGEIDYVEAHGTGTPVGDPVELTAIGRVFGAERPPARPCLVGSAKPAIGHTESAAGLVGLIRATLCLQHRMVPGRPGLGRLNPDVDWAGIALPRVTAPIEAVAGAGLAGVSSFGISGTNAHVVVGDPPATAQPCPTADGSTVLVVSARTAAALDELARAYSARLRALPQPGGLARVAHAAATRRDHHDHRIAVRASDAASAAESLDAARELRALRGAYRGAAADRPRIVMAFPGHGTQWSGMGRELLRTEPAFADALRACDAAVRAAAGWSVIDHLTGDAARVDTVQPVLWALQVALARLWQSWGVVPDVVIGHSMGEVAAAHLAGALSLADAAAVICRRSELLGRLSGTGGMAVVELAAGATEQAIAAGGAGLTVAAYNGPTTTVVSGDRAEIARFVAELDRAGELARVIDVDIASHSPRTDELLGEVRAALAHVRPTAGTTPIRSTVHPGMVDGAGMDAAYWADNLRLPVRFLDAVRAELDGAPAVVIEISPHPALGPAISAITQERPGGPVAVVGSLRRGEPERAALHETLAQLFVAGVPFDAAALGPAGGRVPDLPSYPWQRDRHWIGADRPAGAAPVATHPLLGRYAAGAGRHTWTGRLDQERHRFLDDHLVGGAVIVSGTTFVELLAAAAVATFGDGDAAGLVLRDVHFARVLRLRGPAPLVRVVVEEVSDGTLRCSVASLTEDDPTSDGPTSDGPSTGGTTTGGTTVDDADRWLTHASAVGSREPVGARSGEDVRFVAARCADVIDGTTFYRENAEAGNAWGPAFRGVSEVRSGTGEVLARTECPDELRTDQPAWIFHPAWLDACLQPVAAVLPAPGATFVLGDIDELRILGRPATRMWTHALLSPRRRERSLIGDVRIVDDGGLDVVRVTGIRLHYLAAFDGDPAAPAAAAGQPSGSTGLLSLQWQRSDLRGGRLGALPGSWIVLLDSGSDGAGAGEAVVAGLRAAGASVVTVRPGPRTARRSTTAWELDAEQPWLLEHLLAEVPGGPVRGIVDLWGARPEGPPDPGSSAAPGRRCRTVAGLVPALAATAAPPRLWLVTRGAQSTGPGDALEAPFQAPLWGLGRALAQEEPRLDPVLVDLDAAPASVDSLVAELLAATAEPAAENELAFRAGARFVARLVRHGDTEPAPAFAGLTLAAPGDLDGMGMRPGPLPEPGPGEVRVAVTCFGLNFQDLLLATGTYPDADGEPVGLGKDCVGTVDAVGAGVTGFAVGDRVVAMATSTMATHVVTAATLVAPVPAGLTDADAATLAAPFTTALHALVEKAGLQTGETVLVHAATGGVGLAAVQVARMCGARVFGTAGSRYKRSLLPIMGVEAVADSRTTDFVDTFRAATGGRGVDVLLNSVPGDAIVANLELLAPYGRCVELTKADFRNGRSVSLNAFMGNVSYESMDIVDMLRSRPERVGSLLRQTIELVAQGVLKPLPAVEFPVERVAEAFRIMARAQHVGRVVVTLGNAGHTVRADRARPPLRPAATYLVTGGLGALGLAAAAWLVARGATHLLLTGRTVLPPRSAWCDLPAGSPHAEATAAIRGLEERGAHVEYVAADVADATAMTGLLGGCAAAGRPVRGALHLAGVVDYRAVRDLRRVDVDEALRAKVDGAWVLHGLLSGTGVDFLVLFSSASAVLSSPSLGAYAAGNAFLDALAAFRRSRDLPALSVGWGFWDGPGMAARRAAGPTRPHGVETIDRTEGFALLADLLDTGIGAAVVMPTDWQVWAAAHPGAAAAPLLRALVPGPIPVRVPAEVPVEVPAEVPVEVRVPVPQRWTAAVPAQRDREMVLGAPAPTDARPTAPGTTDTIDRLRGLAAGVLGMDAAAFPPRRRLDALGLDSLMAAELRATIESSMGARLPVGKLLGATLAELAADIGAELSCSPATPLPVSAT